MGIPGSLGTGGIVGAFGSTGALLTPGTGDFVLPTMYISTVGTGDDVGVRPAPFRMDEVGKGVGRRVMGAFVGRSVGVS